LLSEFHKHLQEQSIASKSVKRPGQEQSPNSNTNSKKLCQTSIISGGCGAQLRVPQHKVDSLILNYVVEEMRPLSTVEKPAFRNMITGINPSVTVMCRKTLASRIDDEFQQVQQQLKSDLASVEFVCTTADIWTVSNKSYMGMTVHYVTGGSGGVETSRVSAALACRRFMGSHTYSAIAEMISFIHRSYGLTVDKITATVTDNASNFGKAFREFLFQIQTPDEYDEDNHDDVDVDNISEVLTVPSDNSVDDEEVAITLPHHETCCSHTLNLLATVDADKVSNSTYERLYRAALAKCTAIRNAVHRSSKAADAVKQITEKVIITPGATRWNSQYDAVRRLLQIGINLVKLNEVCQAVHTPEFMKTEYECLNEYVSVMQPIAISLDKLQGEKEAFYGHIMPTLHMLMQKVKAMQNKILVHCQPLVTALLDGMQSRFDKELTFSGSVSNKIVAAISHPYFKMRWIPDDKKDSCRELFIQTVRACSSTYSTADNAETHEHLEVEVDDFFDYGATTTAAVDVNTVDRECINYLSDNDTELNMLAKYNRIQKVFIKFNTTLPSSASVERLFSTAGQIEVPRRNLLGDCMFEKLLLLKANRKHAAAK
jgi:hypothetical protein